MASVRSFQVTTTDGDSGSGSVDHPVTLPPTIVDGDDIVAIVWQDSDGIIGNLGPAAGFTQTGPDITSTSSSPYGKVFVLPNASADMAGDVIDWPISNNSSTAFLLLAASDVDSSNPVRLTPVLGSGTGGSESTPGFAAGAGQQDGDLYVGSIGAHGGNGGWASWSGATELAEAVTAWVAGVLVTAPVTGTGAIAAKTTTKSPAPSGTWRSVALVLRGAPAGTAYTRTQADPVGITDTTAQTSATARSQADAVGITDTPARTVDAARTAADPVGITDTVIAGLTQSRTLTDAVGISDTAAGISGLVRDQADPVGITDTVEQTLLHGELYTYEIADPVGITDTTRRQTDIARDVADPVGIVDTTARTQQAQRAVVDAVGMTDEVASEEIEPPGGEASTLTPDLYAIDPDTGVLTPLPGWLRLAISPVRNDPGAISVDYPAGADGFDVLDGGVTADPPRVLRVEIRVGGSRQGRRTGWLVQKQANDALTPAGVVRFDGHLNEWLLDKALVAPQPITTANLKGELIVDGWTYGRLLREVVDQAQDRGDVLPGITVDFTDTHDSSGQAWAHPITNLKIPPKTTVLDVAQKGVELGAGEFYVDADLVLHAYNPDGRGVDRTLGGAPLAFAHSINLRGHSQKESAKDTGGAVLAAGADGNYAWATNATALASLGFRAEVAVDAGNIDDPAAVLAYAQGQAQVLGAGVAEYQSDVQLTPTGLRPLINYDVGDYGFAVVGNQRRRRRIAQIAVEWARGQAPKVTVAQNDLVSDALAALIRRLNRINSGDAVLGTSTPAPDEDTTTPNPPTGLVADSEAILDGVDYVTVVTVGWTPPATNTDGTAYSDGAGYLLQYRYANQPGQWVGVEVDGGGESSGTFTADPGRDVLVRVAALDTSGHMSAWSAEVEHLTAKDDLPPPTPSTPTASSRLLVGFVTWDGVGSVGEPMPVDLVRVQVHLSAAEVFIAGPDTLRTDATEGIPPGGGTFPILGLPPGSVWWVALVAEDRAGNLSAQTPSVQLTISRAIADDIADTVIGAAKLAPAAVTSPAIAPEAVRTPHLSVAAFSDNLLPNGQMEDPDLVDPTLPAEWTLGTVVNTTAALTRDTTAANVLSGTAAARVSLGAASGTAQLLSSAIPVSPGDVWYLEASARASRAVAAGLSLQVLLGSGNPPTTIQTISGAQGLPLGTAYAEVPVGGANLSIPALVAGVAPRWMRLVVVAGGVPGDAAALDVWVDELRARRVVGSAEIADAAITRAKIGLLAVGSAQVESVTAGQITTGTLAAVVTLSGEFRTAASGRRMVINGNGWTAYDDDGTTPFAQLNIATRTMLVQGEYRSGTSGERIRILSDGTQRIYGASGTDFGELANDGGAWVATSRADGSGRRSTVRFEPSQLVVQYGTPGGTVRSQLVCGLTYAVMAAPVCGIRILANINPTDGTENRFHFVASTTGDPDDDIGDSVLHYQWRSGGPMFLAVGHAPGAGVWFPNGTISAVTGDGLNNVAVTATEYRIASSRLAKTRPTSPVFGRRRVTAAEVIERAPAYRYRYRFEVERDDMTAHQHFGPIAEDLAVVAPELLRDGPDGGVKHVSVSDLGGVMWAALGEILPRLRALEDQLRPQPPTVIDGEVL